MKLEKVRKLFGVRKGSSDDVGIKKVREAVRKTKPKK